MSSKKKKKPVTPKADVVEINFDFTKIDLFDFLDLMEMSANKAMGAEVNQTETLKFVRCLKSAYVSSSRPLTVADFESTISAFWKNAQAFKNPNA